MVPLPVRIIAGVAHLDRLDTGTVAIPEHDNARTIVKIEIEVLPTEVPGGFERKGIHFGVRAAPRPKIKREIASPKIPLPAGWNLDVTVRAIEVEGLIYDSGVERDIIQIASEMTLDVVAVAFARPPRDHSGRRTGARSAFTGGASIDDRINFIRSEWPTKELQFINQSRQRTAHDRVGIAADD